MKALTIRERRLGCYLEPSYARIIVQRPVKKWLGLDHIRSFGNKSKDLVFVLRQMRSY